MVNFFWRYLYSFWHNTGTWQTPRGKNLCHENIKLISQWSSTQWLITTKPFEICNASHKLQHTGRNRCRLLPTGRRFSPSIGIYSKKNSKTTQSNIKHSSLLFYAPYWEQLGGQIPVHHNYTDLGRYEPGKNSNINQMTKYRVNNAAHHFWIPVWLFPSNPHSAYVVFYTITQYWLCRQTKFLQFALQTVAYTGIWKGGTRGGLGACPQRGPGAAPRWGVRGQSPPEAERFPLKLLVKLCNIL